MGTFVVKLYHIVAVYHIIIGNYLFLCDMNSSYTIFKHGAATEKKKKFF